MIAWPSCTNERVVLRQPCFPVPEALMILEISTVLFFAGIYICQSYKYVIAKDFEASLI